MLLTWTKKTKEEPGKLQFFKNSCIWKLFAVIYFPTYFYSSQLRYLKFVLWSKWYNTCKSAVSAWQTVLNMYKFIFVGLVRKGSVFLLFMLLFKCITLLVREVKNFYN